MMESLDIGVVIFNLDGKVKFANAEAVNILGVSQDDIQQRGNNAASWHVVDSDGNSTPQDKTAFSEVLATGETVNKVIGLQKEDGILWLRLVAYPYYDYDGKFTGIVMAFLKHIDAGVR